MAKKSKKKRDVEQGRPQSSGGKREGTKRRKAEKRAEELAAALVKVRTKAQARIEKAQQAIRKAEKRADRARAAVDGTAQRPVGVATEPPAIPTSPTPADVPPGVTAPGPDYAVPVPEHEQDGSRPTFPDVSVPEAITPNEGAASAPAATGRPAVDGTDTAATPEPGTPPGDSPHGQADGSATSLTPPLPAGAVDDEPNAGWTLVRLRSMARERGVPGYSAKSKTELLEALEG